MNTFPVLHTHRCVLREIVQDELPALRQIVDDELFQRFLPELHEMIKTEEGLLLFVSHFEVYAQNGDGTLWGIEAENVLVGFVAIMDVSYAPVLFYAMHPRYRNQGYGNEAVSEVVRYFKVVFPDLTLHTEVYDDNMVSLSILQSCGFKSFGHENRKVLLLL